MLFSIPKLFGKIKMSHPKSHVFRPALENFQFYIGFFLLDFSRALDYSTKPIGNLRFPNQLKVIAQISNLQLQNQNFQPKNIEFPTLEIENFFLWWPSPIFEKNFFPTENAGNMPEIAIFADFVRTFS